MKLECKVASLPVCEREDVPTRWQFVIRFDTERVEKHTFTLLQRSVALVLMQDLGDLTRVRIPAGVWCPILPPIPQPTCLHPAVFCAAMHAVPVQCKPYSPEYLHQGATTLWVPLQQWEPFSVHPALHCFPLRARGQAFLSTHSIRPLSFCRDSLLKAKVSVMCRGIKAKAMCSPVRMTVKFQCTPWENDSLLALWVMVCYQDFIQERLPSLTHTHPNVYKTFEIRLIHQRDIRAGQQGSAASSLRFPLFALFCFHVNLFCFHSVKLLATGYSSSRADLFYIILQHDHSHVLSWAAEQCWEQSKTESQVVPLSKTDPCQLRVVHVVCTEAKFVHCRELGRTVTHS